MTNKSIRWCFNFNKWNPTPSEIKLSASCVQLEERERLMKYVFKENFKSSLIGRLMMRKFASESLNLPYNEINFVRDDRDKPMLKNAQENLPKFSFNVSHQGNFTIFAGEIGRGDILGCDVMKTEYKGGKTISEFFRIMNRNFSHDEWENIRSYDSEKDQLAAFCRHWCLKESYVKALGVGITVSLRDISFKIKTKMLHVGEIVRDTELFVNGVKENWIFEEGLIDEEHCVAVAMPFDVRERVDVIFKELNFEEIIKGCVPLSEIDEDYCNAYFEKLDKSLE